jgi:hypothetical protein
MNLRERILIEAEMNLAIKYHGLGSSMIRLLAYMLLK